MANLKVDTLIVGQGLAGSLLADTLLEQGTSVHVIDPEWQHSSTKVAAGLINPITGHRWNLTARFFSYLSIALDRYACLEKRYHQTLIQPVQQTRLIKNQGQADYATKRQQQEEYQSLITPHRHPQLIDSGFGHMSILQTYIVDTKRLLRGIRNYLLERACLTSETLDYSQLRSNSSGVSYKNIHAQRVVFCEGHRAIHNPWLNNLPFKLAKGSVLEVNCDLEKLEMLSWGKWLAPTLSGTHKLGSTYSWNNVDYQAPNEDRIQLMQSAARHTELTIEFLCHEVGIRPSTISRKPIIDIVPSLPNAFVLNGLGSKGCLLAPYYCQALTEYLLRQAPLPVDY